MSIKPFNTATKIKLDGGSVILPTKSVAISRLEQAVRSGDYVRMRKAEALARKMGETDNHWYQMVQRMLSE